MVVYGLWAFALCPKDLKPPRENQEKDKSICNCLYGVFDVFVEYVSVLGYKYAEEDEF